MIRRDPGVGACGAEQGGVEAIGQAVDDLVDVVGDGLAGLQVPFGAEIEELELKPKVEESVDGLEDLHRFRDHLVPDTVAGDHGNPGHRLPPRFGALGALVALCIFFGGGPVKLRCPHPRSLSRGRGMPWRSLGWVRVVAGKLRSLRS